MKNLTKMLILILLLSVLGAATLFSVGAEDSIETGAVTGGTDAAEPEESDTESTESPFALLFEAISSYSGEIMSALSLIGSLIIAFTYKSGLTPMLKNALGGMMNTVNALKAGVAEGDARVTEMKDALSARIAESERSIEEMSKLIPDLEKLSETALAEGNMHKEISALLTEQINMLYDIFMSSGLPQYRKDEVGERVAAMRQMLASGGVGRDS